MDVFRPLYISLHCRRMVRQAHHDPRVILSLSKDDKSGYRKPPNFAFKIPTITLKNSCLPLHFFFLCLCISAAHVGEEDDVPDRRGVGQQHHQPVDADPLARRRRHAVFQGPDVVLVHPWASSSPGLALSSC